MKSEVSLGYLCEENGFFCPFMDRSGTCIATSCKRIWDIYERNETEKWAKEQKLIEHERLRMKEEMLEKEVTTCFTDTETPRGRRRSTSDDM